MPFSIIRNPARPDDDFKQRPGNSYRSLHKDVRVKLNQKARSHGLRRNRRRRIEGIIISPLPVEQIVTVLWDGRTKTESWHVDFLEEIPSATGQSTMRLLTQLNPPEEKGPATTPTG
jgi:hypothetical protein